MNLDTEFLERLASADPTPGGGGASAYAGALAAATASMVGNLTVGKPKYAAVEEGVRAALDRLAYLRERLLALVDEDARAFTPLGRAYRMPRATPEEAQARRVAVQDALGLACDVPIEIMRACAEVIEEADYLARHGSKLAVSDAGAAAVLARGALVSAAMNVYLNVESIEDAHRAARYRAEVDALVSAADERAGAVAALVMGELR